MHLIGMRSNSIYGRPVLTLASLCFVVSVLAGCASYGVIKNEPLNAPAGGDIYSIRSFAEKWVSGDTELMLAFSGGGTRAAAFSYGVLKALRDTGVVIEGRSGRLLDEVDYISSVSGGSFTAAYYGLYGDKIFDDFEEVFLRRNVQGKLIRSVLNPLQWFRKSGRTESAINYYEKNVFHGATFGDMKRKGGPLILINTSDLGYGARFSFVQEYFDLLCSDLSSFSVARAVTASSAVPVLFNPVVVENYQDCKETLPDWLVAAEKRALENPELAKMVDDVKSYFKKEKRQYAHFVDGGITDNLGLRTLYENIEIEGGPKMIHEKLNLKPPRRFAAIVVNAFADPQPEMDATNKQPSLAETISSVTNVQIQRYNTATLELMRQSITRWAKELSTQEKTVTPYFIHISFKDIQDAESREFFNQIPTSFSLTDEQVDRLIAAGRELLRNNADFQQFLSDLNTR
jgi:NTE family protein